jgi:transmembrane sensor
MNKIVGFPDRDVIEDEALEWLIRLDGDKPLDSNEEQEFEEWLARSPAHRETLKSLNGFWANCNVLGELVEPMSVVELCKRRTLSYFWSLSGVRFAAATAVFMVLTLGVVLGGLFDSQGITGTNGVYVTAVGQQKILTLTDGSHVQLNTNSQIQVDYNEGFRNIQLLQGEVHFDVAKDPSKPFRVYAGNGRVQAVGTAFNVYLNHGDVDVFVTEGRVALGSTLPVALDSSLEGGVSDTADDIKKVRGGTLNGARKSVVRDRYAESDVNGLGTVSAGQGVTLKKTQTVLPGKSKDTSEVQSFVELVPIDASDRKKKNERLAWRKGLLIFSGEPLEKVVEEISRYIPVEIEIMNPELRQIEIGGQIQVGDTDSMFKALEANFGLKIRRLSYNRVQVVAIPE